MYCNITLPITSHHLFLHIIKKLGGTFIGTVIGGGVFFIVQKFDFSKKYEITVVTKEIPKYAHLE